MTATQLRSGTWAGLCHAARPDIGDATIDAATLCRCSTTSLPSPTGDTAILRVEGDIDLFTVAILEAELRGDLARRPRHLVVDLADMRYCGIRGLTLLIQTSVDCAADGTGYAVSGASDQAHRLWAALWPADEAPGQFASTGAAVAALRAVELAGHMLRRRVPSPPAAPLVVRTR